MAFKGERLVIESLQVRGGKGDVAAALLAARELVALGHDGVITLVLSEEGLGILSRLVNAPLAAGEALPGESIVVHTLKSIPPGFKPADLYLAVARADAVFPKAALRVDRAPAAKGGARGVPINDQTIVAVVPVFGSTEQKTRDWTRTGLIQMGEQAFEMQAPGLSASHSGVYVDTVATQLRFKGPQERRSFILEAITGIDDPAMRGNLSSCEISTMRFAFSQL